MNRLTLYLRVIIFLILTLLAACKLSDRDLLAPPSEIKTELPVKIAKWLNNHKGAVSLNYDQGDPQLPYGKPVQELILQYKLTMDYELVVSNVLHDSTLFKYITEYMLPNGFGFFGHGYEHINHDALSYDECLESFSRSYNYLKELGIKPVAFAYPGGWGYHLSTRKALKDAGFLSGRKFEELDISNPYIVPDTVTEPKDWYALPTLVMQSVDYDGCVVCINNSEELLFYLKENISKKAWIIVTYHSIGVTDAYGFYELDEFEKDLQVIKSLDLWCAKTADAILYTRERKNAAVTAELISDDSGIPLEIRIILTDGLPNDYYDQPLTLLFNIPEEWMNKDMILIGSNSSQAVNTESKEIQISIPPDESLYRIKLR